MKCRALLGNRGQTAGAITWWMDGFRGMKANGMTDGGRDGGGERGIDEIPKMRFYVVIK